MNTSQSMPHTTCRYKSNPLRWLSRLVVALIFSLGIQPIVTSQIVVSELMYHPAESDNGAEGESLEYIEFYNSGSESVDLGQWYFEEGVQFVFPNETRMQPGSYLVLAKDADAVSAHYSIHNVFGNYEGQLSNSGEEIVLVDGFGDPVLRFRYGSVGAWPASADGAGHSLVILDHSLDNDLPGNWSASHSIGGSPGTSEPSSDPGDLMIHLVRKGSRGSYFKGNQEPSSGNTTWTLPDFETDDNWLNGQSGFGYSNDPAESDHLSTILNDMRNSYISLYARIPFDLSAADLQRVETMRLVMNYDDSFVAYLNGVRIGAAGVSGNPPPFDQSANAGSDYDPLAIDLTSSLDLLKPGINWLAIQGHNVGIGVSSDFVMGPELVATLRAEATTGDQQRSIVINEVFANGTQTADFIELYNPNDTEVDIGGMWLSDKQDNLMLYQIPSPTIITAGGFLVQEISVGLTGFGISSLGEQVFLTAQDGSFVAASYAFGPMDQDVSIGRYPDGGDQWFYQHVSTPGQINVRHRFGPVVLNEIMYHPVLNEEAEYIELLNISQTEVPVGRWKLRGVNALFPSDMVISGDALALVAGNRSAVMESFGVSDNIIADTFRGRLRNSGESIGLLNNYDVAVDWIEYSDSSPWPVTADGLGSSIERGCWSDELNQSTQWFGSPIGRPSPGAANFLKDCPANAPDQVVIAEFLYHAATDTEDERDLEFIKIQNVSNEMVSLDHWVIAGSVFYLFPEGTLLSPGRHLTIASSPERLERMFEFSDSLLPQGYGGGLPNGGGDISLIRADGRLVDQVSYDDDYPWPSLADGYAGNPIMGYSLQRRCDVSPGMSPANWVAQPSPAPNGPNPQWDCESLSTFESISMNAQMIFSTTTPEIVATLSEFDRLDNIQSVTIEYFVDDFERENEALNQLPLQPDVDQQGVQSPIKWTVTLPAQSANSVVRYRVKLQTDEGLTVLSPDSERDAFAWHAYFVDPAEATIQPNQYHLFISSSNWRQLHNWTAAGRVSGSQPNPTWNNEVSATFVSQGQVFDVTVRHQGSRWNRRGGQTISFDCPSHLDRSAQVRSWRIRFPSYRNWDDIDTLILQKQSGWPQRVSFKMFELAGVPAPRTSWADLRINGCSFNPDAFQIERPGRDMVDRWFDDVGDLFKSQGYTGDEGPWSWGDARLIQGSRNGFSESDRYEYTFNRKTRNWTNEPGDGKADIVEPMIEGLHQARDRGTVFLRNWLADHFDVDLTLRYICTINYVGTFDDMFQNHYLYRKAEDGKWCMFPWDMDNTLGGSFGEWNANPYRGAEEMRIGNVGNRSGWWNRIKDSFLIAYEDEFLELFYQLNNTVHSPEALQPFIESIAAEGNRSGSVSNLMNHIQRRHSFLNEFIEPRLGPPDLELVAEGANVVVAWELGRTDFRLESTSELGGEWLPVGEGNGVRQDSSTSYTISPNRMKEFFRLAK